MKQLATACDPEGVPQGAALVGGGLEMEELDSPHHSGHHCPCGVASGPMAGAEALSLGLELPLIPLSLCFSFSRLPGRFPLRKGIPEACRAYALPEVQCSAHVGICSFT